MRTFGCLKNVMGIISKLVGQTAIYGLSTIIGRFLNFMLVPLYTRCFSQSEYGVVTELYSYTVFLMIFLTYGMETGFFRFVQNKEDQPKVFSTIMTSLFSSSAIFVGLVYLFLSPISSVLGAARNQVLMKWERGTNTQVPFHQYLVTSSTRILF